MSDIIFIFLRKLRTPLIIVILVYSIATLGLTLIPGVDDQGQPWQMSFFHAFYFVSFMGSTIGFGEIPYDFTDQQRLWVLVCIYTSVIAWLYAIGHIIALLQDPAFKLALVNRRFEHSIQRLNQPFYIICGYGETGKLLNRGLADYGANTVVIDHDSERISLLELEDLPTLSISLNANITEPKTLIAAGLHNQFCRGVVAVTQDDHINLQVAVSCKLLNAKVPVYCRSEIEDESNNMASFGTDKVIAPYEIFAKRLNLLTHSPKLHQIQNWFINQHSPEHLLNKTLPKGKWIICGHNRFGRAVLKHLETEGIELVIVDENPELNGAPEGTIIGRGTEASTLLDAGIHDASVIIAGTNDDPNNLSILITAKELNPEVYTIGRINIEANYPLFEQAHCQYALRRCQVVANEALTYISRPLISSFIHYSSGLSYEQRQQLIDDILEMTGGEDPITWRLDIGENKDSKALHHYLKQEKTVPLEKICRSEKIQHDPCIVLLLRRDGVSHILPDSSMDLQANDQILFCGKRGDTTLPHIIGNNIELIDTLINNNPYHIPILRWLWHNKSS